MTKKTRPRKSSRHRKSRSTRHTVRALRNIFKVTLLGIAGLLTLAFVLYFLLPNIFYSIYNRVTGSYQPAKNEPYNGIDVSHHNGVIDWPTVARNPKIQFAYIKATEGYRHLDKQYSYNNTHARHAGIKTGAYHLLTTKTPMQTQFDYFRSVIDKHEQDLIPMVDIEEIKVKSWSRSQLQDSLAQFISLCEQHYGVAPVIYCSHKFYKHYLAPRFDHNILFLARYSRSKPELDNNKKCHDIWQFTERGHVDGIKGNVDLDRFGPNTTLKDILF